MTLFHRSREGHHHALLWCLRFRHWSYNYASLTITLRTGSAWWASSTRGAGCYYCGSFGWRGSGKVEKVWVSKLEFESSVIDANCMQHSLTRSPTTTSINTLLRDSGLKNVRDPDTDVWDIKPLSSLMGSRKMESVFIPSSYIHTLFTGSHYDTWRRIVRLSLY